MITNSNSALESASCFYWITEYTDGSNLITTHSMSELEDVSEEVLKEEYCTHWICQIIDPVYKIKCTYITTQLPVESSV